MYPFHVLIFGGMARGIAKATGLPVLEGPKQFKPDRQDVCKLPNGSAKA
jgi:hypothetical protein